MRSAAALLVPLLALAGCGGDNTTASDLAPAPDLTAATGDLAMSVDLRPPADLACFGGPDGTCAACLAAHCEAMTEACFGANWQTMNDPGAQCGSFYTCQCACKETQKDGSSGNDCLSQCAQAGGATCQTCINDVFGCIQNNCAACM